MSTQHEATADSRALNTRFALFAFLFAVATLFYHGQLRVPFGPDLATAAFVSAIVVLVRPSSVMAVASLAAFQTLAIYQALPAGNTNRTLQFLIGIAVLLTLLTGAFKRRSVRLTGDDIMIVGELPLKLLLLVVYFWAVVHKLNWEYLSPAASCAVELLPQLALSPSIPASARMPMILMPLAVEGLLIPLLVIRSTRAWGVRLGTAFHLVLGIAWFYSFSATMVALLSLFLPVDVFDRLAQQVRDAFKGRALILGGAVVALLLAFAAMLLYVDPSLERTRIITSLWQPERSALRNVNVIWNYVSERLFFGLWCLAALPIGLLWIDGFRRRPGPAPRTTAPVSARAATAWPVLIAVALTFANGAAIYVGWKTETAFAMYSNLRTEPGYENHLFMPTVALAPYQSHLVVVRSSNDDLLQAFAAAAAPIPFIELRRRIAERAAAGVTGLQVTYEERPSGRQVALDAAERVDEVSRPLTYVERKFLRFREIRTGLCTH